MGIKGKMDIIKFNDEFLNMSIMSDEWWLNKEYWEQVLQPNTIWNIYKYKCEFDNPIKSCNSIWYYSEDEIWEVISKGRAVIIIGDVVRDYLKRIFLRPNSNNQKGNLYNFLDTELQKIDNNKDKEKQEKDKDKKSMINYFDKIEDRIREYTKDYVKIKSMIDELINLSYEKDFEDKLDKSDLIYVKAKETKTKPSEDQPFNGVELFDDDDVVCRRALNFTTGQILTRSPGDYITTQVDINMNYFKNDEDKEDAMEEAWGILETIYPESLTPTILFYVMSMRGTKEAMCMVNTGTGMNGKSKMVSWLFHTFGRDFVKCIDQSFFYKNSSESNNKKILNSIKNCRLIHCDDLDDSMIATDKLKVFSENHVIETTGLYKDGTIKTNYRARPVINKNSDINIKGKGMDGGLRRRLKTNYHKIQFKHEKDIDPNNNYHVLADNNIDVIIQEDYHRHALFFLLLKYSIKHQNDDENIQIINDAFMAETLEMMEDCKEEWQTWINDNIVKSDNNDWISWTKLQKILPSSPSSSPKKKLFKEYILEQYPGIEMVEQKTIAGKTHRNIFYGLKIQIDDYEF